MKVLIGAVCALLLATSTAAGADDGKPSPQPRRTQSEKMKQCNQEAKEKKLKGDERKTFMSGCLRGDQASRPRS
jgi:hypothetical protein